MFYVKRWIIPWSVVDDLEQDDTKEMKFREEADRNRTGNR